MRNTNRARLLDPNSLYTPQIPNAGSALPYTNNRWAPTGASYDAAGNQLSVKGGAYTFSYDGENRQRRPVQARSSAITTDYTYDGDGKRISRTSGGATTVFVYDAAGNLSAECENFCRLRIYCFASSPRSRGSLPESSAD